MVDLLNRIEDMKVRFDQSGELSSSDKSFIDSYYERILSKSFNRSNCNQCYRDAFIEIYIYVKQNGIKKMGKYILKREELIHIAGDPQVYTRANLTDDIAIKYLKKYPNAISKFESFPDKLDNENEDRISDITPVVVEDNEPKKKAFKKKKEPISNEPIE